MTIFHNPMNICCFLAPGSWMEFQMFPGQPMIRLRLQIVDAFEGCRFNPDYFFYQSQVNCHSYLYSSIAVNEAVLLHIWTNYLMNLHCFLCPDSI